MDLLIMDKCSKIELMKFNRSKTKKMKRNAKKNIKWIWMKDNKYLKINREKQ